MDPAGVDITGARRESQVYGNGDDADIDISFDEPGPMHGEEEDQERDSHFPRYAQEFTAAHVADILGLASTAFERIQASQEASGAGIYTPFADEREWELAEWLIRNVNQHTTDEFLKLPIVSRHFLQWMDGTDVTMISR